MLQSADEKQAFDVYWNNLCVGCIVQMGVDNFCVYGKWYPAESPIYDAFLAELQAAGEAWVWFDPERPYPVATVDLEPDDEIEIKYRPKTARKNQLEWERRKPDGT